MSYQALYRAWRPKGFSGILGQEPITTTLSNQIKSGRVAHAYLFCGSRGTGKTSTAKVFAMAVNCLAPCPNGDPCGTCEACVALSAESNMDVMEIDAASNNGVDEIRELRANIKYPPTIGRYKVYIVDEVHMLSAGAFNALLKTLEEPPAHAVFILATTEPQRLPATILSRCQRYDFKRIASDAIVSKLRKELSALSRDAEESALYEIARASEGGMRDAESLLDMCLAYSTGTVTEQLVRDVLGTTDRSSLFQFAGALLRSDAAEALRQIEAQMRDGRDAQIFAREVAGHMRALILAQLMPDELAALMDLTGEDAARYAEQAKGVAQQTLTRIMALFSEIESGLKWATQPRTVLELCAVRACQPQREQSIEALLSRISLLEQKIEAGLIAAPVPSLSASAPAPKEPEKQPPASQPAIPAPAPAPKPKPTHAKAKPPEEWEKMLALLSERAKSVHIPLTKHSSVVLDGDALRVGFPKAFNMFMNVLQTEDKLRLLSQIATEAFGRPMEVSIMEDTHLPAPKSVPASATADIDHIYSTFGRDKVSVVDDL